MRRLRLLCCCGCISLQLLRNVSLTWPDCVSAVAAAAAAPKLRLLTLLLLLLLLLLLSRVVLAASGARVRNSTYPSIQRNPRSKEQIRLDYTAINVECQDVFYCYKTYVKSMKH